MVVVQRDREIAILEFFEYRKGKERKKEKKRKEKKPRRNQKEI